MNPDWVSKCGRVRLVNADCRTALRALSDRSVHCCVTSPPYWGLRDYGVADQIGLEPGPAEFVAAMVDVFSEVLRVLRDDGTLWLNLGDSYCANKNGNKDTTSSTLTTRKDGTRKRDLVECGRLGANRNKGSVASDFAGPHRGRIKGIKPKDLVGIPWRVAFALQEAGWYLRQDIIWHKPNPMPESVRDRCTKAHEYIFLLSKSQRYYFDQEAIAEEAITTDLRHPIGSEGMWAMDGRPPEKRLSGRQRTRPNGAATFEKFGRDSSCGVKENMNRNKRSVWTVTTKPYSEAHFATFPPDLIRPCILAGCPEDGVVLDPFAGSGTTLTESYRLNRQAIGIELNPDYCEIAKRRIGEHTESTPLLDALDHPPEVQSTLFESEPSPAIGS